MVHERIMLQDGGEELQRDIAESIALYEKAADLGCTLAMAKLAHIYEYGCKGIEIDKTKGLLFRLRTADLDSINALYVLALSLMYEDTYPLQLTDACKSASGMAILLPRTYLKT